MADTGVKLFSGARSLFSSCADNDAPHPQAYMEQCAGIEAFYDSFQEKLQALTLYVLTIATGQTQPSANTLFRQRQAVLSAALPHTLAIAKVAETQGNGTALATKAVATQGKALPNGPPHHVLTAAMCSPLLLLTVSAAHCCIHHRPARPPGLNRATRLRSDHHAVPVPDRPLRDEFRRER